MKPMELARMDDKMHDKLTDKQARLLLQEKIRRTQHKMVDAIETIVDTLAAETAPPPAPSRTAERRQIANLLGTSHFCAKRACRRARCCLGEPTECLRVVMPLLDGGRLAGLLARRKRPRRVATTAGRG
jgi:hypothetical protein